MLSLAFISLALCLAISLLYVSPVNAANSTVTMKLSYRVVGPAVSSPPTFTYFYQGLQRTVPLSAISTSYQVDTGTPWSVTPQLLGSNGTVRWATEVSSGTANNATVTFSYYYQYRVDFAYKVLQGGTGPIVVSNVTQWGVRTALSAGGLDWVDGASHFAYPSLVDPQPGERWLSTGLGGLVSKPSNYTLNYNHQYLFIANYLVEGGGSPSAPVLTGMSFNSSLEQTLGETNSSMWLDAGTAYQSTDPLQGSNSSARWYAAGGQGVISSPTVLSLVYYHQYSVTGAYSVIGGSSPAPPALTSQVFGKPVVQYLTGTPRVYWLDAGANYNAPQTLPGTSSIERWAMSGTLAGIVASPLALHLVYFHQYLMSWSYTPPSGYAVTPTLQYTSFGSLFNVPIQAGTSSYWGDSGSVLGLSGNETSSAGNERWVETSAPPGALAAPFNHTLSFVHQFDATLSYSVAGGGEPGVPSLNGTSYGAVFLKNLTSQSTPYWLDAGTVWSVNSTLGGVGQERWLPTQATSGAMSSPISIRFVYTHQYYVTITQVAAVGNTTASSGWYVAGSPFRVSAYPANGWTFSGWEGKGNGAYTGANQTLSLILNAPIEETPVFDAPVRVSSGVRGSVTYYTSSGQGTVKSEVAILQLPYGDNVTLAAAPSSFFYAFSGWTGAASGSTPRVTIRVDSAMQVNANFAVNYPILGLVILLWAAAVLTVAMYLRNRKRWQLGRRLTATARRWAGGPRKDV